MLLHKEGVDLQAISEVFILLLEKENNALKPNFYSQIAGIHHSSTHFDI